MTLSNPFTVRKTDQDDVARFVRQRDNLIARLRVVIMDYVLAEHADAAYRGAATAVAEYDRVPPGHADFNECSPARRANLIAREAERAIRGLNRPERQAALAAFYMASEARSIQRAVADMTEDGGGCVLCDGAGRLAMRAADALAAAVADMTEALRHAEVVRDSLNDN